MAVLRDILVSHWVVMKADTKVSYSVEKKASSMVALMVAG